jgi:heptosyltransferase II
VTNDSGPMHIAAATKTPLVVIFGTGDPEMFGPYTEKERFRIIFRKAPGSKTVRRGNRRTLGGYIDWITVEEVFEECRAMLQTSPKAVQKKHPFRQGADSST